MGGLCSATFCVSFMPHHSVYVCTPCIALYTIGGRSNQWNKKKAVSFPMRSMCGFMQCGYALIIKKASICFILQLKAFNFILMPVTIYWSNISCSITVTAKLATFVAISDAK